jgi:hypothetical protein
MSPEPLQLGQEARHVISCGRDESKIGTRGDLAVVEDIHVRWEVASSPTWIMLSPPSPPSSSRFATHGPGVAASVSA